MNPEIGHLPMNPFLKGQAGMRQRVVYSKNGQTLTLILPWANRERRDFAGPAPLIVFIQGSGWATPDLDYELPMLSRFAEEGAAVATVSHRSTLDGHPFPAFLQDVKCAIRFLRAHAEEYVIDGNRVAAFGTSSGGHTACMLGVTGDDPAYRTEEYPEESDRVCAVVSCFGPLELVSLFGQRMEKNRSNTEKRLTAMFGPDASGWPAGLAEFSPALRIRAGERYPSFLLMNGSGDPIVPCEQMEFMYARLKEAGAEAAAY